MVVTGLDAVNGRCLGLACRADKERRAAAADGRAENIPLHLKDFRPWGAFRGRHPAAGALRLHPAGISFISGADPHTSARGASGAFPPGERGPPPRGFPPHVPHSPPPARGFPPQTGPPRTGFLFADTATARERPEADLAVMVRPPGSDWPLPPIRSGQSRRASVQTRQESGRVIVPIRKVAGRPAWSRVSSGDRPQAIGPPRLIQGPAATNRRWPGSWPDKGHPGLPTGIRRGVRPFDEGQIRAARRPNRTQAAPPLSRSQTPCGPSRSRPSGRSSRGAG